MDKVGVGSAFVRISWDGQNNAEPVPHTVRVVVVAAQEVNKYLSRLNFWVLRCSARELRWSSPRIVAGDGKLAEPTPFLWAVLSKTPK